MLINKYYHLIVSIASRGRRRRRRGEGKEGNVVMESRKRGQGVRQRLPYDALHIVTMDYLYMMMLTWHCTSV